ncbi:MAG: GTPase Era [Buchnera aphidicola (Periphyllus lyropictus)]|uniref:GTPase Era n=1 Tax=Buchnera aphidicola TaxID=9 RepID=UPI001EC94646|nr:GTPase Era [Buchnera aphidicola]NIH16620.1 GTPase Era [Buchnera aphidicola (Periphyllus lyropictus)]USS94532.1 GTPase Era [Buchnera aphidicola (Periphyllus lyropictus)]
MKTKKEHCGKIAIIGDQNSGKSTLMNILIKKKISITSKKKNTTQQNITGIKTKKKYQFIYIDTPGFKKREKNKKYSIKKIINFQNYIFKDLTIVLLVIEKTFFNNNHINIINLLKKKKIPIIIIINKSDKIKKKNILLPFIKYLNKQLNIKKIIPCSAKTGENIKILKKIIKKYIPIKKHIYKNNVNDNLSLKFKIHEIIREKIMRYFGDELPYTINIKIFSIKENIKKEMIIKTFIYLKHERQKKIFIGKNGEKIKLLSLLTKKSLEKILLKKIHLYIWIKYKKNYQKCL